VEAALAHGAAISAVNWAEVLSKFSDLGEDPDALADRLGREGLLGTALLIRPLDEAQARWMARLRRKNRPLGLSLGDRACLALGLSLGLPILTTDQNWKALRLAVKVRVVR